MGGLPQENFSKSHMNGEFWKHLRDLQIAFAVSCGYDTCFAVRACDGLLHSEIDQIHLSIEAQCDTTRLPLGDCHTLQILVTTLW